MLSEQEFIHNVTINRNSKKTIKGKMMEEYKRLNRTLAYKGTILEVYKDEIEVCNGNTVYYDYIHHKGAAAVLPVMEDGRLLMVIQYRNAIDRYSIELPAGGLDSADERPIDCAKRELLEETGYTAESMEELISIYTTIAFCNEKIPIYVAHIKGEAVEQKLDENEFVRIRAFTVEELIEKIYDGTLNDSKTVAAVLAYKNKYCDI